MDRKPVFNKAAIANALEKVHPGRNCYHLAGELATNLLHEYPVEGPPFSPFHFAERLGIRVVYANIEAEGVLTNQAALRRLLEGEEVEASDPSREPEGAFIPDSENGPRIVLRTIRANEGLSVVRRRKFTLAHEIGHYVIRKEVSSELTVFSPDDPEEEALCNIFASELLMPGFRLNFDLTKYGISPQALLYLEDRYEVSLQALLCRVSRIFRGTVITIIWTQGIGMAPVISWSGPTEFRRAILCGTGSTPIESAFLTSRLENGMCDILLDGQRSRWNTMALRLSERRVLSVMCRSSANLDRYLPINSDVVLRFESRQLSLAFESAV